ncbi:ABC transporter permease [Brevibacillus reuszeri]|uniref:ABC transporter permease n=1 Tax=Brevibacillus reuszeri TaxID=54915 RepID=UPI000CCC2ABE|nr:ABC transporter permease [Brevibacillus reuszeri]
MNAFGLEFFKLRRKHLPLMIVLFLCVELGWVFASVSMSLARNPDGTGWEAMLATVSSMNGLFLPILAAVVVSRLCDMEHKGNTWGLLMAAAVNKNQLYAAKYTCANVLLCFAAMMQVMVVVGIGYGLSFTDPVPFSLLIAYLWGTVLTNLVVIGLQQWVSIMLNNQAFCLSLGMIGGFIGMTSDLFPSEIGRLFIWSYYSGLSPVTYQYVNQSMEFVTRSSGVVLPMGVLAMVVVVYGAGSYFASRREV